VKTVVVTCVRDEGPFLVEWIAHHRAIGVTDFLVFHNDCGDGSERLLEALAPAAGVTVLPVPDGDDRPVQWRALDAAAEHPVVQGADWVMAIDADEFVDLAPPLETLADLVEAAGGADAIVLPWRLFGNSGHVRFRDAAVTETFLRAAPEKVLYPPLAGYFKTLYRRSRFRRPGVHRPKARNMAMHGVPRWVDGSGRGLPEAFGVNERQILLWGGRIANDLVQLNHYSVRSAESFMIKRARGLPNHRDKPIDLTYWVERNFNVVEDRRILRHAPARRAVEAELIAVGEVRALHQAAVAWHRQRFRSLLRHRAELELFGRLVLAGGSTPPDDALARELVELYQEATP